MHILYLMPAEGFGGAERQGLLHIKWLRQLGYQVTAVIGRSAPMLQHLAGACGDPNDLWLDHFPPRHSAEQNVLVGFNHGLGWLKSVFCNAATLETFVSSRKVDVILANRTYAWVLAAALCRRTALPFVIRAGSRPRAHFLAQALRLFHYFDVEPNLFVSNCRAVEDCFTPYVKVSKVIVPNAVDTNEFSPRDAAPACLRLGLDHERPRVALAMRPSAEKGIALLFDIAKHLQSAHPRVELVVAGDYWERTRAIASAEQRGLQGVVRFLGHVHDVADLYAASDVVLLTSRKDSIEGSPNALLEAMACGKPVVATAVGGVPELIRHERDGLLVPDNAPDTIAQTLDELLDNAAQRENLGSAGRSKATQEHSPELIVRRLASSVEEQLSKHAGAKGVRYAC